MRDSSSSGVPAPGPTRAPEPTPSWRPRRAKRLLVWAAGLSVLAAFLHAEAAPMHWEEWWGYGLFFVVTFAVQLVYGLLLLLFAVRAETRLPSWARSERLLYGLGIAGNAALVALYLWTRTIGNPAGPSAGEIEEIEPIGVISKLAEVALIGLLAVAMRKGSDVVERREWAAPA